MSHLTALSGRDFHFGANRIGDARSSPFWNARLASWRGGVFLLHTARRGGLQRAPSVAVIRHIAGAQPKAHSQSDAQIKSLSDTYALVA